jgi:ADP-ribose pyrophosphatase YjhB (NUDIX family)
MHSKSNIHLTSTFTNEQGEMLSVNYYETDPNQNMDGKILQGVHAFCIVKSDDIETNGKMVLVLHPKSGWMPPGGGIEAGESYQESTIREVKEETNMKVLEQKLIGFQDVSEPNRTVRQVRSFCIVEPYGDFEGDPDGEIQEIKLVDPKGYRQYFDWGFIGDHIMSRVMEYLVRSGL